MVWIFALSLVVGAIAGSTRVPVLLAVGSVFCGGLSLAFAFGLHHATPVAVLVMFGNLMVCQLTYVLSCLFSGRLATLRPVRVTETEAAEQAARH